ncbi:calcium/proton exchanger [Russula decolorans]
MWRQHKREKPLGAAPGVRESISAIIKTSRLNVLLIFIPLSWIFHYTKLSNTLVFVFSFLAVVPLAKLIDFATDDLSLRLGPTLAGLLKTTLGNAVDLIVAIIALVKCQLTVVQLSREHSFLLCVLLLVLGTCLFAGGTRFSEQGFGISAAHLDSSLLTLSVIAVLLPAAFHNTVQPTDGIDPLTNQQEGHDILSISHGVAIILLFIYLCYIVFQLFSHKHLYDDSHTDVQQSVLYPSNVAKRLHSLNISERKIPPASGWLPPTDGTMDPDQRDARSLEEGFEEEEEIEEPKMSLKTGIILLIVVTVLVAFTAGFLVDSIDGLTSGRHISKWFVGLILLPNMGNAADHLFFIMSSVKLNLQASLGAAVGSSIQISLFAFPFIVILGWILGKPLTLLFDLFESVVLFLSILTVNNVVKDGKSHWLKGMILICLYIIIAVTFWYYPVSDPEGLLSSCK